MPAPGPVPVAPAAMPAPVVQAAGRPPRSRRRHPPAPPRRRCSPPRPRPVPPRRPAAAPARAELALAEAPIANGDVISALEQVLFTGASDLHVTANSMPMLRVDGRLRPVPGAGMWNQDEVTVAVRALMTEEQQETFDKTHELDFAYAMPGGTRFRVNGYQQRGATGAAFRIISTTIRSLEELNVPDVVAQFATLPRGLVLVTGPTGSGKSTTLAALIDLVNRTRFDHIVTVEDPIEYVHGNKRSLINQREVGSDTHSVQRRAQARAASGPRRHPGRRDARPGDDLGRADRGRDRPPGVRDPAHAERGADHRPHHRRLPARTSRTRSARSSRRPCRAWCRRPWCPARSGTGRVIATEVLITTPAISNLIREGKSHQITSSMQAGRALGMHTMDQHLADLVNEGEITREAAFEKAHDPDSLERLIRREDVAGSDLTFDPSAFGVPEQARKH